MKRIIPSTLFTLAALSQASSAHAALRVVATVPDLAALARDVGGELVTVSSLSLPTQDPHFVDPRPSLALELSHADLLILVGLELEAGWLPTLLVGSRNAAIQVGGRGYLDASRFVSLLDAPTGKVDRAMGDIHPGGNPHYLYDPRAGQAVARAIASQMAELDPEHAATFRANADRLIRDLETIRARVEDELKSLTGAKVIAFHRTLPYLAAWLQFEVVAHIEPKPGIPPNPSHTATLLAEAKREGVRIIVQEEYYSDTVAGLIAERAGAQRVKLPGGARFRDGEGYRDIVLRRALSLRRSMPEEARAR